MELAEFPAVGAGDFGAQLGEVADQNFPQDFDFRMRAIDLNHLPIPSPRPPIF
jgi:hypothetical protein